MYVTIIFVNILIFYYYFMYPLKIKEKYDQSNLNWLAHRFTVVYLGTYKDGDYTENVGSHPGVDIVPAQKNQEVLACLDGKVFKAWEDGAYGKFVFLEHTNVPDPDDLSKTTTLYSCHEHLSEVKVNIWDIVKEWDVIGKTGNTGNSFGEHLHFQIDRMQAPFHAYWPFTWTETKAAGTTFTWWVNIGLWIEKARMYTINPLVYLDKVAAWKSSWFVKPTSAPTPVPTVTPIVEPKRETIVTPEVVIVTPTSAPIPPVTEEKINIATSNDNLIIDPSANLLSSLSEDIKKKLI